jgi:phosphatidylglycerol:prolipoprotein diacylglycerol transferase
MIPFFQWTEIQLGPLPIQVWGLMVALGIALGLRVSVWAAKQRGLEHKYVVDAAAWIIVASLFGGRAIYVLSEWQLFAGDLASVIAVWEGGMSISGGFIGALIAAIIYFRAKKLPFFDYADVTIFGLPIGLFIGRLGCFFIFDHPGAPTSFFLGETYIDGIVRHNHGLYLSLNGLLLTMLFFLVWKRKPAKGTFVALFALCYGLMRFALDFFRATDLSSADSRWFGLTVAQYLSLGFIVGGGYLWYAIKRKSVSNQ